MLSWEYIYNYWICCTNMVINSFFAGCRQLLVDSPHGSFGKSTPNKVYLILSHLILSYKGLVKQSFYMMTSSNGNIFRITGHLCGELPVTGEFPAQRLVTQIFDVFFDLCLNKDLRKQSWGWWFQTPLWPLWCHSNDIIIFFTSLNKLLNKVVSCWWFQMP